MLYFLITKVLLQPMPLLFLLAVAAFANLWRRKKENRGRLLFLGIPLALLILASTPAVVYPFVGALEWNYPPVTSRPTGTEAIVVPSGGVWESDQTRKKPELAIDTLYRCLHAAELYHQGLPCPVVVTGGALDPTGPIPPVAPVMRDCLLKLGVADAHVIVEPTARTTFENAVETRAILKARNLRRIVLVTEAVHMPRALKCFRKQGIDAEPAACFHRATEFKWKLETFTPSPGALLNLMAALHEWQGLAWYWVSGKL